MNVVPTQATYNIARDILTDTPKHGADATLRHLPDVHPDQMYALVALLARAAVLGVMPPPPGRRGGERGPATPIRLTAEERRAAHRRYAAGARDAATVRGEREYQRVHRQRARAAKIRAGKAG